MTFFHNILLLSLSENFKGPTDTLRGGRGDVLLFASFLSGLACLDQAQLWVRDITVESHWAAQEHNTLPAPQTHTTAKFWNLREELRNSESGRCRQENTRGNDSVIRCRIIFICALTIQTTGPNHGQDLGWASWLLHQKWGRKMYRGARIDFICTISSGAKTLLSTYPLQ